jgi:hypothetical protein
MSTNIAFFQTIMFGIVFGLIYLRLKVMPKYLQLPNFNLVGTQIRHSDLPI